jgi:hypothetical protein
VSIRLNAAEARVLIDAAASVSMPPSSYIRNAALGRRLVVLPQLNREAWRDLGRTSGLLNQALAAVHGGKLPDDLRPALSDMAEQVRLLRLDLVAGGDDDEEEHA